MRLRWANEAIDSIVDQFEQYKKEDGGGSLKKNLAEIKARQKEWTPVFGDSKLSKAMLSKSYKVGLLSFLGASLALGFAIGAGAGLDQVENPFIVFRSRLLALENKS